MQEPAVEEGADRPGPPTLRVTIGRIEVVASEPPAPPRPKVGAPEPRLSLEAYLEQRRKGGGG